MENKDNKQVVSPEKEKEIKDFLKDFFSTHVLIVTGEKEDGTLEVKIEEDKTKFN